MAIAAAKGSCGNYEPNLRRAETAPFGARRYAQALRRYQPTLTPEQSAENDWVVDIAERSFCSGIGNPDRVTFVGKCADALAGFVIVDRKKGEHPEIDWLIVAPELRGRGVAQKLMDVALARVGPDTPIQLGVIHFNERALAFYRKYGFADPGRIAGKHKIPRKLLLRQTS